MASLAINGGAPVRDAPYPHWPQGGPEELEGLRAVLESGNWTSSHGTAVRRFEESFAAYQGAAHGICVANGEVGLQLALEALQLDRGAEVIIPAYTFVASATAVLRAGGVPVFADVDPATLCLDVERAHEVVGEATAALMPVHLGGRAADMETINEFAAQHGLRVVEDAAQAVGSTSGGRPVGALGNAGAFSFQASKNITAGEGGIILTNDEALAASCRALADCGRGAVGERYLHTVFGGNFRLSEFQGAVLNAQLDRYPEQLERRDRNARALRVEFEHIPGVAVQALAAGEKHSWHLVIVRLDPGSFADVAKSRIVEALNAEGVPTTSGYLSPPYDQPLFRNATEAVRYRKGECPAAERACARDAVWFRQQALLAGEDDAIDIARALAKVQEHAAEL